MSAFFKSFGKGILYLLTLPVVLVVLLFYAIIGLFVFLFLMVKSVILFFKGKTIFNDFPEDVKVKEILSPKKPEDEVEVIEPETHDSMGAYTQTYFQSGTTTYPTFEDKKVEEIETQETPLIEETLQEETQDTSLFMEEPEVTDKITVGKDDIDLEHFDLGSKRIVEDEEE